MQRHLLLITPVITTKPASSDLIIRAPVEKTVQVKPCCASNFHLWALPQNLPSWILPWLMLMVVVISHNPPLILTYSASFLQTPALSHLHLSLAFFHPSPTHVFLCPQSLYCLLASLMLLPVCGGGHVFPKLLAFVILKSIPRCLSRVQVAHRAWFSTQVAVQMSPVHQSIPIMCQKLY